MAEVDPKPLCVGLGWRVTIARAAPRRLHACKRRFSHLSQLDSVNSTAPSPWTPVKSTHASHRRLDCVDLTGRSSQVDAITVKSTESSRRPSSGRFNCVDSTGGAQST